MKDTRIALAQMQAETGNVEGNLKKIAEFAEAAAEQKADMICFPELCITGYNKTKGLLIPEIVPGPSSEALQNLARRYGMVIMAGLPEVSPYDKPYIAQLVAFPDGRLLTYRKTHLGKSEIDGFTPGDDLPIFSGEKAQFGIGICWDMHFPELSTVLALKGAEIIFAPHASPQIMGNRRNSWLKYMPARAYDNGVYIAACNLVGSDGGEKEFCGGAMVLDPKGNVVAESFDEGENLLVVDLPGAPINKMRRQERKVMSASFFLDFRRPELYHELINQHPMHNEGKP
ncbi:nitrilase-related carbon-nitrogen hydrolase [Dehalobacterium formicoaceticum]|uniref:Nitrilase n=1 Tax=Dehalobacterium formicoaceticum TaxID=51515 RepID=A0ABT1Y5A5_9FIRM|nr:nitrilase-related carbon-nitrogen hydrolase [Dehalobacterium formicoaceticum]MCR6544871.1 nitrilase [Dehalobacterium formicoaceticum]